MKNYFKKVAMAMLLLAMANVCAARQWHVNNYMGIKADFAGIGDAMASEEVVEGDTIYIGAGSVLGSLTISKKVTVIGTGWGYSDSPATVAKINGDVTITAQGAKVVGLYVSGVCNINAHDVVLERCQIASGIRQGTTDQVNDVKIFSCRTVYIIAYNNCRWEIKNNLILDGGEKYGSLQKLYYATIENNIVRTNSAINSYRYFADGCNYCIFKNNVLFAGISDMGQVEQAYFFRNSSNTTIKNNVISLPSTYESTWPGNVFTNSTDITLVFKCTGSVAGGEYYSLCEGSPAIGAGEGGIDCGVMAGAYKFVPYGRPQNIPVIKSLVTPYSTTGNEINVTVGF